MKNSRSLELCHAWSKQQKHDYNVKYYKENKENWYTKYNRRREAQSWDNDSAIARAQIREMEADRDAEAALRKNSRQSNDYINARGNSNARSALLKALGESSDEYRDARRRGDAARLDTNTYEGYGRAANAKAMRRAPSAAAPTGSAGNPTINKAKRIAESTLKKAANSYKSAYEAGLSSLAKAGKNFINKIAYREITYTVPGSDGWVSVKKVRTSVF